MACHGFAGAHLWDHHPIESGLQDFRRPFTLSHSPLPLNYARQQDRTGRLLILILIVILLGLGSWRLRVRLRLRLGRSHSALIQWQCPRSLPMKPEEHPTSNIEWQRESSLTSAFEVRCWTFDVSLTVEQAARVVLPS